MKRGIIIPTYSGHFGYVKDFLYSYKKFVYDSKNVEINFILSDAEEKQTLEKIIAQHKIENVHCWNIIDILGSYGIHINVDNLLNVLGKFSYQTIKKLYAIHYLKYEQSLVLDSESLICSRVNINNLFDNYFKAPYVFYSKMPLDEEYKKGLDYITSINVSMLLNITFDNCWYLEGFHWFYDIKIVNDLFEKFQNNLYNIIFDFSLKNENYSKAIFECILYYQFIKNENKYHYNFINSTEYLQKRITDKEKQKINNKMIERNCKYLPFTIHGFEFGGIKNIKIWAKFLKKYHCQIVRLYPIRNKKKMYIIKNILQNFDTKIICSTDEVGMYKKFEIKKFFLNLPLIFNERCNQW